MGVGNHPIRLRGVSFAYQHGPPVLGGLDLELREGESIGLVGHNGSGKTTLLHLIVGLLKPAAGEVEIFGKPRRTEADFREVRARVGLLFQDADDQLFSPTVAEDVAFGPLNLGVSRAEATATVGETLAAVGLAGFEERIIYRLSAGEKRLVSLAAVLAMRPDVLLLDEPLAGLDDEARERIAEILAGMGQAKIVISHDRGLLRRIADRAVRLEQGKALPFSLDG